MLFVEQPAVSLLLFYGAIHWLMEVGWEGQSPPFENVCQESMITDPHFIDLLPNYTFYTNLTILSIRYLLIDDVTSLIMFALWKVDKSMRHRLMPVYATDDITPYPRLDYIENSTVLPNRLCSKRNTLTKNLIFRFYTISTQPVWDCNMGLRALHQRMPKFAECQEREKRTVWAIVEFCQPHYIFTFFILFFISNIFIQGKIHSVQKLLFHGALSHNHYIHTHSHTHTLTWHLHTLRSWGKFVRWIL